MQSRWEGARTRPPRAEDNSGEKTFVVHLEKALLDRCAALAKKKRISRDDLLDAAATGTAYLLDRPEPRVW